MLMVVLQPKFPFAQSSYNFATAFIPYDNFPGVHAA